MNIDWDQVLSFLYGIDRVVFYREDTYGIWPGVKSLKETSEDAQITSFYLDGELITQQKSSGTFQATIESVYNPEEIYLGRFNMTYRTQTESGYKIHILYNVLVTDSDLEHETVNSTADAASLSWDLHTTPVKIPFATSGAHLVVDSNIVYANVIEDLEAIIYGSETNDPYLPGIEELTQFFEDHSLLKITDNGDGSWTAEGPDDIITMLSDTEFQIDWPYAIFVDANTYTIRSF